MIIEHIEKHVGEINKGFSFESTNQVQIIKINNQPFEHINTFCTLGLSNSVLPMNDRKVRQELVFSVLKRFPEEEISSFLWSFSNHLLKQNKALLAGDIIELGEPIINGIGLSSIYVTSPVFFNDSFFVLDTTNPPTVMVWLIPVTKEESYFIKTEGSDEFESLLEKVNPDFWNLGRTSTV